MSAEAQEETEKPGPDGLVPFTLGRDWLGHKPGETVRVDPEGAEQMYKAKYDKAPDDMAAAPQVTKKKPHRLETVDQLDSVAGALVTELVDTPPSILEKDLPPRTSEFGLPSITDELKIKGENK